VARLGAAQLEWLIQGLASSRATWKIVCCDVPIGLVIFDGPANHEGFAQDDPGPPLGREHELAALFAALRERRVKNVLFITADVHYAAAHRYAALDGLWEFVAGPLHAGTFGPNRLDPTFGPEAVFVRAPPPGTSNLPPWDGMQSFGALRIDGRRGALEAALHDGEGSLLWRTLLEPAA
jgi:alkaline phosphatase D